MQLRIALYYPAHPPASTTPVLGLYLSGTTQCIQCLGFKPMALCMLGKWSISTKPHSQLLSMVPTSFYEATITWVPKLCKEIHRSISLMNISAKILNKILEVQIWEHIKKIIYHDKFASSQRYRDGSLYIINKCNLSHKQTERQKSFHDIWSSH